MGCCKRCQQQWPASTGGSERGHPALPSQAREAGITKSVAAKLANMGGSAEEIARREELLEKLSDCMEVDIRSFLAPQLPLALSQEVEAEGSFSYRFHRANAAEKKAKLILNKSDKEVDRIRESLERAQQAQRECSDLAQQARERVVSARTAYDKAYPNPRATDQPGAVPRCAIRVIAGDGGIVHPAQLMGDVVKEMIFLCH